MYNGFNGGFGPMFGNNGMMQGGGNSYGGGMGYGEPPSPRGMPQQNYGQAARGMANRMGFGGMGGAFGTAPSTNASPMAYPAMGMASRQMGSQFGGGPAYGAGMQLGAQGMAQQFNGGMPSQVGFQQGMGGAPMPDAGRRYFGNMPMPMPNPGFSYGGGMPSPDGGPMPNPGFSYGGGMPSPDGGPAMNPGIPQREFANGNPFYNAKGNLRMRYRDSGMVPNKYGEMVRMPQPGDPDYGVARPY